MSNITVCARFRPLSAKEKLDHGDSVSIQVIDDQTFILKDEKEGEFIFSFDRAFYDNSEQDHVYSFLARPIIQDAVRGINGTIITYGQTGAGKTFSMEGPNILDCDKHKKGLLARAVYEMFELIASCDESMKYIVKLSMFEIYMEKVRDLFDLSKDNIQIKKTGSKGLLLHGVSELSISSPEEALQHLSCGIVNRAVGETQMNMASSRSHCVYMFTIQLELSENKRCGKLILVDLAGSERVEKTGAEGRVLEEAKTINKSLSSLGNVVYALTSNPTSKVYHIPYRDSKLTRILQDGLGGNSRTALLCCCSPSPSNASESLSTLRFGARAKHIKASPHVNCTDEKPAKALPASPATKDESHEVILNKLPERSDYEGITLLEDLEHPLEGTSTYCSAVEDMDSDIDDVSAITTSRLKENVVKLSDLVEQLVRENIILETKLAVIRTFLVCHERPRETSEVLTFLHAINFLQKIPEALRSSHAWVKAFPLIKLVKGMRRIAKIDTICKLHHLLNRQAIR